MRFSFNDSKSPRRTAAGALPFVLLLSLGCDSPSQPASAPTETVNARPAPIHRIPERALAYVPTDATTDARIAGAQRAVRTVPDSAEALDVLAALFFRRHRETADPEALRCAEDCVLSALDRDPRDTVALSMRGMLSMQRHQFAQARDQARSVLAVDPEDTTALLLLGDAESELGNYESAVTAYQRAAEVRPDLRVYNRAGYMRFLHGDVDGALEMLQLAGDAGGASDPESLAWCLVDVATIHAARGDRARVRVALDQALQLMPGYLPALRLEARSRASSGDDAGALTTITEVLAKQETVGDLLFASETAEHAGDQAAAERHLARARRIAREDRGTLALWQARHGVESAEALATTTDLVRSRADLTTLSTHALALARNARHEEARQFMTRALSLGTPDPNLYLRDALVRSLAPGREGAAESLARADALDPTVDPVLHQAVARALSTP